TPTPRPVAGAGAGIAPPGGPQPGGPQPDEGATGFARVAPGSSIRIVPDPGAAVRARRSDGPIDADDFYTDDDVGDVRWLGGTQTSLPRRPPR
ncbi:MAG: hypothetical protein ACRDYZ_10185, partial [Acidimicrobiales bacterium]